MRGVHRLLVLGLVGILGLVVLVAISDAKRSTSSVLAVKPLSQGQSLLVRILSDDRLWGPDAVATFGSLAGWRAAGEAVVVIFPDRAASGAGYETSEEAVRRVAALTSALKGARPRLAADFEPVYARATSGRAPALRLEAVRSLEDDRFHVVARREGGQFLRPGVLLRVVMEAFGRPERTTTEVIHSDGDRRPTVLTIHHYANGAVKFAESDQAPVPGVLDRVLVDVAAATAQLFR